MASRCSKLLDFKLWLRQNWSKSFAIKSLLSLKLVTAFSKSEKRAKVDSDAANSINAVNATASDANDAFINNKASGSAPKYQKWDPATIHVPHHPPRNVLVLCHGLGFLEKGLDKFPKLQLSYWGEITDHLKKLGCKVISPKVPITGSISERAKCLHQQLESQLEPNTSVNLVAHSMGGLDCRYLLTHIQPKKYRPETLTTLSCPHYGSPFMDWCYNYLGLGRRQIVRSLTAQKLTVADYCLNQKVLSSTLEFQKSNSEAQDMSAITNKQNKKSPAIFNYLMLARMLDCPAYANLTTFFLQNQFNPVTPNLEHVEYFSLAARIPNQERFPFWHPFYLPYKVVSDAEGPENDGLVSVKSATWGKLIGIVECDHWQLRGRTALSLKKTAFDVADLYCSVASFLQSQGY